MRHLAHEIEPPRSCSYLPDALASLENRLLLEVTPSELGSLLERGWRRFGAHYFRPACTACGECVSLRIPVARFVPSPSQVRAYRRSRRFLLRWGRPRADSERLDLYHAWHEQRESAREWPRSGLTHEQYFHQFAFPHPAAHELTWRDEAGRLAAVGLADATPAGLSAVYFFYRPDIARLSPGVANVLHLADIARQHGVPHLYLGYRVRDCASLRYKANFRPHELLVGRPGSSEEPRWVEAGDLT